MSLASLISTRSRTRKFDLFMEMMAPTADDVVLDVGVDPGDYGEQMGVGTTNFFEAMYPWPWQIVALGLHDGERFTAAHPRVNYVQADGCALPFRPFSFDIVFSNAVIEHVGDWAAQERFAQEVMRVGANYFVTTPNRRFPVETHTRIPFVHWLPQATADRIYLGAGKPRNFRLLTAKDMQRLFPDAEIINLGMTLVAIRRGHRWTGG